jgi:glyoxylase-like metal-dependent hydrolase (beta-lactamase superfamily II)
MAQHLAKPPTQLLQSKPQGRAAYSTSPSIHQEPTIHPVFEPVTGTFQYIVADPHTHTAALVDPVLDYDPVTQAITTTSADILLELAKENGYKIDWILETHAHADHLTAASYLQTQLEKQQGHRPVIGIGKRIGVVQEKFAKRYGVLKEEYAGAFDKLFDDDEVFTIGTLEAKAIHLPGHTPDHLGYKIGGKTTLTNT